MSTDTPKSPVSSIEDEWLKASEARYDSMKTLLQSVRHDIDALTSRIDLTRCSPRLLSDSVDDPVVKIEEAPSHETTKDDLQSYAGAYSDKVQVNASAADSVYDRGTIQPDLLANVYHSEQLNEVIDDEYMNIRIRQTNRPFSPPNTDDQLIECTIVETHESGTDPDDESKVKTWRSPSDFSLHDPFDGETLNSDFGGPVIPCVQGSHGHQSVKETDLDDLPGDNFERDDESCGSISPAVSPTFENFATEDFSLNNILVTNDETGHFHFDSDSGSKRPNTPEVYQIYDDGHALTTIDEASEEIEDDWSSSDIDGSAHSSEYPKLPMFSASADSMSQAHTAMAVSRQSINTEFKTIGDSTLVPLTVQTGSAELKPKDNKCVKPDAAKSSEEINHTFVFDANNICVTDSVNNFTQVILVRPKRPAVDGDSNNNSRRPVSTGSLRVNVKNSASSIPDSVQSMFTSFSQESVMSEADSYVTVCSRFATTGSDDVYTTACSDSDLPVTVTPKFISRLDDEDCSTLSRKRTKLTRNQRNRPKGVFEVKFSSSSSDDNEDDNTISRTPEVIVVTPKFSRLPSKIASPKDNVSVSIPGTVSSPDVTKNEVIIPELPKNAPCSFASPTTRTLSVNIAHKRAPLQRPTRRSRAQTAATHERTDSDVGRSSGDSSSSEEAEYDVSRSSAWPILDIAPECGALLPNLVYKPCIQSIHDEQTRVCIIRENTPLNDQNSDIDDPQMEVNPSTVAASPTPTNNEPTTILAGDSCDLQGEMVVPKYIYLSAPRVPLRNATSTPSQPTDSGKGALTCTDEMRLAESNQLLTDRTTGSAIVDSPGPIGQVKVSQTVQPLAAHAWFTTGRPPEKRPSGLQAASAVREDAAWAHVTSEAHSGDLVGPTTDTGYASDMRGTRVGYCDNPNYMKSTKYKAGHDFISRSDQSTVHKGANGILTQTNNPQTDPVEHGTLPLAAVLASAEATSARPAVFANSAYSNEDLGQRLRALDTHDAQIRGQRIINDGAHIYLSTTQERSMPGDTTRKTINLNSTQEYKNLNSSMDADSLSLRPAHLQISNVLSLIDSQHSPTDPIRREYESVYRLSSRESRTSSPPPEMHNLPLTSTIIHEVPSVQTGLAANATFVNTTLGGEINGSMSWSATSRLHGQLESATQSLRHSNQDDIQVASQRTSRIIDGSSAYPTASVKLMMAPNTSKQCLSEASPHLALSNMTELNKRAPAIEKPLKRLDKPCDVHTPQSSGHVIQHSRIQLMQAPLHTGSVQRDSLTLPNSIGTTRASSPSPSRIGFRRAGARASPPLVPPKWHLKPIPTDNEIRERLRSRSRQRAEERQSRSSKNTSMSSRRTRSSRSDSRYRCTDLDSAIAEFKTDTFETLPSSGQGNEMFSETKQSTSLFDLETHAQKVRKPLTPGPMGATDTTFGTTVQNSSSRRFFGDAKSYNSLLETDIDTGENFERPIVLETDVDNLETHFGNPLADELKSNKAHSLFNLASYTPAISRRQAGSIIGKPDKLTIGPKRVLVADNWERTKSLQGLPDPDKSANGVTNIRVYSQHTKTSGIGAKGLIDRLRDRARSTHELRIAQSLTKLKVPEWLDKAECLSHVVTDDDNKIDDDAYTPKYRLFSLSKAASTRERGADHVRSYGWGVRSLSSMRKPVESVTSPTWFQKPVVDAATAAVETVAEPVRPRVTTSYQPQFIRPSQELRQRGSSASRLRPIESKLHNSMRSLTFSRHDVQYPQQYHMLESRDIRPQVAPRTNKSNGQSTELKLIPQDFIPRREQLWGQSAPAGQQSLYTGERQAEAGQIDHKFQSSGTYLDHSQQAIQDTDDLYQDMNQLARKSTEVESRTKISADGSHDDIKPFDYDSGTEHSVSKHEETTFKSHQQEKETSKARMDLYKPTAQVGLNSRVRTAQPDRANHSNMVPEDLLAQKSPKVVPDAEQNQAEWYSIDAEGETESEATDGLDQISDLTCLTSLVDTCASRHKALLANRPSALDHLLTNLGWWPSTVRAEHQYYPPTAAEAISIAAHEFDVDEDSHRFEFLRLLAGPESRRPINLGEFALNHLSGAVQRKQEDGLLYINCGRSECTKPPIKVEQAMDWCACANCYTLYCSLTCRSMDRRAFHDHPTVCSFARAKRACNLLLRSMAPDQMTGLTALAKTGMARVGRGGILLPFALVQHAETFLQHTRKIALPNNEPLPPSAEYAFACWEKQHLPSPGGLMAPPLYLTLQELEELDSSVAVPCRTYVPSSSMVVIVVVCAYELIARSDGRPVHLFKQSLILPFPARQSGISTSTKSPIADRQVPVSSVVVSKPNMPQTNGRLDKPDRQVVASREAYMIRLQRILRERGVSLRHHYPDIYTHIANFVESGVPFEPFRIVFHDFVLREEVLCTIQPMVDPLIQPTRLLIHSSQTGTSVYEMVSRIDNGSQQQTMDPRQRPIGTLATAVENLRVKRDGANQVRETQF